MDENQDVSQEQTQQQDPGAPQQGEFNDYNDFISAKIQFEANKVMGQNSGMTAQAIKEGTRQGVAEALAPAEDPLPDDEHAEARREAEEWEKHYMAKAERAEKDGFPAEAKKWRDISEYKRKDLEALGPSKREQVRDQMRSDRIAQSITTLGFPQLENDPIWEHPRMQSDAGIEIARFNQDGRRKIGVLPREREPWGELKSIRPSNMLMFNLPEEVLNEGRRFVYSEGFNPDPTATFKRTWQFLRQSGYAGEGKPTFGPRRQAE